MSVTHHRQNPLECINTCNASVWCVQCCKYNTCNASLWCVQCCKYSTCNASLWCVQCCKYSTCNASLWCVQCCKYWTYASQPSFPSRLRVNCSTSGHHTRALCKRVTSNRDAWSRPQCLLLATRESECWQFKRVCGRFERARSSRSSISADGLPTVNPPLSHALEWSRVTCKSGIRRQSYRLKVSHSQRHDPSKLLLFSICFLPFRNLRTRTGTSSVVSGQSPWLLTQRSQVRFPALPDFLSNSGSGTRSTQPLWG
jgi:hypothetical protein